MAPKDTIGKICTYQDARLGLSAADRRRLWPRVARAIEKILRSSKPLFSHPGGKLRTAVAYLHDCEPRLALCDSSWGACALLSRSLRGRQLRRLSAPTAASTGAAAAVAAAPAPTGDDGDVKVEATQEEQLVQGQLYFPGQLE